MYRGEVLIVGVPDNDMAALPPEKRQKVEEFKASIKPEQEIYTSLNGGRLTVMKLEEEEPV